jgi:hypothetical protein
MVGCLACRCRMYRQSNLSVYGTRSRHEVQCGDIRGKGKGSANSGHLRPYVCVHVKIDAFCNIKHKYVRTIRSEERDPSY